MSVYYCELSGEMIDGSKGDVAVVTPSGRVCGKRLLLKKLAENGGVDPFADASSDAPPLSEDSLVALKAVPSVVPPRTGGDSTISGILNNLRQEYDALVLELFDTRKALEETRRELSMALYQNDAAVRVAARLSRERDEARSQLKNWSPDGEASAATATTSAAAPGAGTEPPSKKRKVDEAGGETGGEDGGHDKIPADDLKQMVDAWDPLHKGRKAVLKKAAASAPSPEDLSDKFDRIDNGKQSWHKTSCKGIAAMTSCSTVTSKILTAGTDKEVAVYNWASGKVEMSVTGRASQIRKAVTCVDLSPSFAVAGTAAGQAHVLDLESGGEVLSEDDSGFDELLKNLTPLVDVRLHPDGAHLLSSSAGGRIVVYRLSSADKTMNPVAVLKAESEAKYTCGCLHPDGLIYVAGSAFGEVLLWDLKSQAIAGSFKGDNKEEGGSVTAVMISPNGYHVAVAHSGDDSNVLAVWDLRKQKRIAILNGNGTDDGSTKKLESIDCVAFDESGKYLAFGGSGGVHVTTAKEWGLTARYETKNPVHNLAWITVDSEEGENGSGPTKQIIATSQKQRGVIVFGPKKEE